MKKHVKSEKKERQVYGVSLGFVFNGFRLVTSCKHSS